MCGRFTLTHPPEQWPVSIDHNLLPGFTPRYNIAPSQHIAVLVNSGEGTQVRPMQWGFVPHWVHDDKPKMAPINARIETAAEKPMFRKAMAEHRCLVPASGFYEWQATGSNKQPWYIHPADEGVLLFGGVYSRWQHGGQVTDTVALLTTAARDNMTAIHDRMPVRVKPTHANAWLAGAPNEGDWQDASPMLTHRIGTRVNSPRNDDPSLITPPEPRHQTP
ncbi:MAG: SOS response-associated peptidase [Alcanivoracaceae bacterium]|nr:SOS response-associated peptidase [Alcanivoracaceae bacterium]